MYMKKWIRMKQNIQLRKHEEKQLSTINCEAIANSAHCLITESSHTQFSDKDLPSHGLFRTW